jgi:hypothetical protein
MILIIYEDQGQAFFQQCDRAGQAMVLSPGTKQDRAIWWTIDSPLSAIEVAANMIRTKERRRCRLIACSGVVRGVRCSAEWSDAWEPFGPS